MWRLLSVLIATIIGIQSAAIVDNHTKCKLSDGACWTKFFEGVVIEASDNGLPDLDIPRLDPYIMHNIEITILGLLNFTIIDGQTIGGKSCRFDSFNFNVEEKSLTTEATCEKVTVEGEYVLSKTSTLTALLGNIDIRGNGKGTCVIDKLKANLEFFYDIEKGDDGETYYKPLTDATTYTYKVGKVEISGGHIYIGTQEITQLFINIFNENWETMVKVLGNNFFDRVLEEFYGIVFKFFKKVPINKLTLEE